MPASIDSSGGPILVIGSASIDTKGRAGRPIQPGTSTPGAIRVSVGGVARNVAENLARLGEPVVLLAAVGQDSSGRRILQNAAEAGIDVQHVLVDPNHHTAAYIAVLDETGKLVTSIDDMAMTEELIGAQLLYRHRGLFRQARMVIVDANLSPTALRTVFGLAAKHHVPVCADPTSATLAPRLRPHLGELMLITPNEAEAEALCGSPVRDRRSALAAAKKLVSLGVKIAMITLGPTGLVYASSQESGHVPAMEVAIVDSTGAGDALTAAVVFGLLNNLPVGEAARLGLAAATMTLQSRETVHPGLSLERLYDQLGV
jgi:pseudouridine kinase